MKEFETKIPILVESLHRLLESTPMPLADAALYIAWRTWRGEDAQTAWDNWGPSVAEIFGPADEASPDEEPASPKEDIN